MQVRAMLRVKVRTGLTFNQGTLDNGNPWSNHTFEAIDSDDNKLTIRAADGNVKVDVGSSYDVLADIESQSGTKLRVKAITLTPARAAAA